MLHFTTAEQNNILAVLDQQAYVLICEIDGRIRKINQSLATALGYEPLDLVGQHIDTIVPSSSMNHSLHRELTQANLRDENTSPWVGQVTLLKKNGYEITTSLRLSCIKNGLGRLDYLILSGFDVTEYRVIEQSLTHNEQFMYTMLRTAPVGIAHTNCLGQVQLVNEHWCELASRKITELIGKPWYHILEPEHQAIICQQWLDFMSCGIVGSLKHFSRFRIHMEHAHQERWVLVSLSGVQDESGNVNGYIFSIQDISHLMAIEKTLQETKADLLQASRLKSEFLANVSHEIRTPMNGILGMAEVTLNTELKPEQRKYLHTIMHSGQSLLSVVNDILDFSKIESGKMDLAPIQFKLRESLDETLRLFLQKSLERNVELLYHIKPNVPNDIVGDVTRIRQIFSNLISNAVKFTHQGQIYIEVGLADEQPTEEGNDSSIHRKCRLAIQVSDTGIGIEPEYLDHIFEPFTQADASTTRRYGGTGLGLSICKQLVELMDGSIRLESQPNHGTTFHVEIMVAIPENINQTPLIPVDIGRLAGLNVLIVDDNDTNLQILTDLLLAWSMVPVKAKNSLEAVNLITRMADDQHKRFDLVMLDVKLGETDGFELAKLIKRLPLTQACKIIMLPSYAEIGHGAQCRELNIEGYLTKPISQQELLQCIRSLFVDQPYPELITRHSLREQGQLLNILLVEDNQSNTMVLQYTLTHAGHDVLTVTTTTEAIEKLKHRLFDVLLISLNAPLSGTNGNGLTLAKQLRSTSSVAQIPIIAIADSDSSITESDCLQAGMNGYIIKPYTQETLLEVITKTTMSYRQSGMCLQRVLNQETETTSGASS